MYRALVSAAILLAATIPLQAQRASAVRDGGPKQEAVTLEVGEWHVFKFEFTKPFVVEADSLLSTEDAPAYHDQTGKAVVVFGRSTGPATVQVRAVIDNKTVYRAVVTINQTPVKPQPSPYIERLRAVKEPSTPADIKALADIYAGALTYLPQAATGRDVWDFITVRYLPLGDALKLTRREIGVILGETTTDLYKVQLDAAGRKQFKAVLGNIEQAVRALEAGPGPNPQPIPNGPHKVYMVVVEEATQRTPIAAALLDSTALAERFKAKGHRHLVLDKDVIARAGQPVPEKLQAYLDKAKGKQLPYVIIADITTGKLLHEGPLPTDEAGIMQLLDKVGG